MTAAALCLLVTVTWSAGEAPSDSRRDPPILVTVGDVTSVSAYLWAWAPGQDTLRLTLDPPAAPGMSPARLLPRGDGRVVTALRGLSPGLRHRYRLEGVTAAVSGEFVTAPAAEDGAPVRIAWSGDLGSRGHCRSADGWPVLDALAGRAPDVFLFVGDTIYADHYCGGDALPGADFVASSLEEFHAKHLYNRADPAVQRLFRRTSVVAIWDDHEVRSDFSGPTEPLTAVGLRAFLDAWPMATPAEDPTRLYRRFRWGRHVEIFVLDARQYRSANHKRDGPDKTMLGPEQRRWLVESLAASTATWKLVVSSVPLSIAKGWPFGDSWARRTVLGYATGFAAERDAILADVRRRGIERLVVLAADVHYGAFMTHRPPAGPEVHELIAGPLAARPKRPLAPDAESLHTTVHAAQGGGPTFGELQVTAERLTARLLDVNGRVLAEISWSSARPGA
jgi:alkaline phosphatase D